jgi:YD repeat-containing protein
MSRSHFLGARRRAVTEYEYDSAGRMARSVTTWDPEWTDEDRGWAIAFIRDEATRCGGCGQPAEEAHNPATSGTWTVEQVICQACRVLDAVRDNYASGEDRHLHRGLRFRPARTTT